MRKFISGIFLFLSFHAFAFDFSKRNVFVQLDLNYFAERGIERDITAFSFEAGVIENKFKFLAGTHFYEDVFDFTTCFEYYPNLTFWKRDFGDIFLGFGFTYHFQNYFHYMAENDFILDTSFNIKTKNNFIFSQGCGFAVKDSQVYAIKNNVPHLWDYYLTPFISFRKIWQNGMEASLGCFSHEMYRYPLFISPSYTFGIGYNFDSGLRLFSEATARISDGFTTAPYLDRVSFRFSVRYLF